jgi:sugar phosphate permease
MQLGGAVGGLLVIVVALALESFGWRSTALVSGILVILFGLPLVGMVQQKPEDMGYRIDGDPVDTPDREPEASEDGASPRSPDFTLREALRTPAFWLISLGHGSALLIVSAVTVHLVLHLTETFGYSLALASLVVTVITAGQIAGTLLGGVIGDRFDKRKISMWCMAAHTAGLILVATAVNGVMVFAFAILHGMAWGLRGPMMGAIRADYFGRSSYGAILGTSSLITMFGSILGPLIAGFLADHTGGYDVGFTILALLAGMGSVFFLMAKRPVLPPSPSSPATGGPETPAGAAPAVTPGS